MRRQATCACGGLTIALEGEPEKVSSCCCQQCQRRTGSFFGVTAFFLQEQIVSVKGEQKTYQRVGESGHALIFHFCPECGSTVFWYPLARPGRVAVAAGSFADAGFPPPERMIWTEHRHPWVRTPKGIKLYDRAP
jgi:hypothetical protein